MAQAAEDPTGPDGVAHALAHPVALRDAYVSLPLGVPTHLDRYDDVVGPFQGLATIRRGKDAHR